MRFAKTPHTVESLAVRIDHDGRSIAYTGDTSASDELPAFFRDVDVLIAECSFMDDDKRTPHLTADGCARLAAASRARHLVATHCYFDPEREGLAARLARTFDGRITVATDGLSLEL
jgi:ribonuclease BN (tRNA processing enzyme)